MAIAPGDAKGHLLPLQPYNETIRPAPAGMCSGLSLPLFFRSRGSSGIRGPKNPKKTFMPRPSVAKSPP
ncbi:MAG: hypothetical protein NTW41_07265 [Verrucomicrobia bacterium]|nr:hypothetical protein [Verrucomicrobiota bacterium]